MENKIQQILRNLPGVDQVLVDLEPETRQDQVPRTVAVRAVRRAVAEMRRQILSGKTVDPNELSRETRALALGHMGRLMQPSLRTLVNATGVVVHTNLGRSCLSRGVMERVAQAGQGYSNLEFDLEKGARGSRYSHVEELLTEITGAEAAMVVNNNAGAVLLCLETLASGKKVIVSRGELVEIGGSFRIPDVMAKSGAKLCEVGATNRTHPHDYQAAIDEETAMLFKAHTSNFAIVGFTKSVTVAQLVELAAPKDLLVMEDLGSGSFLDLSRHGLAKEPTVGESVAAGAHVVTFSGDKLLGGPQAGIIVGKKAVVDAIKKNPITRALRIDKMTLAALEETLRLYRDPEKALKEIPTLRLLTRDKKEIQKQARNLARRLKNLGDERLTVREMDVSSRVGGGALPLQELPSRGLGLAIRGLSPSRLEQGMRTGSPPVIGRVEDDIFILDMRCVLPGQNDLIVEAARQILESL